MKTKPVGNAVGVWSGWKAPDDWRKRDIPPSPGVYQLAVFRDGQRATIRTAPRDPSYLPEEVDRLAAIEESNRGLVYVGKAICLDDRFWRLVRSWQMIPTSQLHDSRKTYNQNHRQVQSIFQPSEARCRYKRLSVFNWRTRMKGEIAKLREELWPDSGQGHERPSAVATFSAEGTMLKEYLKWFRELPLLNKKGAEDFGPPATDEEIEVLWHELERFDDALDESTLRVAAYYRWIERKCPHQDDWGDWFAAQQETWERILKG